MPTPAATSRQRDLPVSWQCSRCARHLRKEAAEVFYIGSNRTDSLTAIRRQLLTGFERLPIAGEYIHRDAYDIGERYGKDSFLLIDRLGTSRVPAAFALKSRVDGWLERLGLRGVTDRVMQVLTGLLPSHLPKRMGEFRQRYEHHLLLKVSARTLRKLRPATQLLRRPRRRLFPLHGGGGTQGVPASLCRGRCRGALP